MKPVQRTSLVVVVLLAALVAYFALRMRQPPLLPLDRAHAGFDGADACLTCHGPQGDVPRSKNHPLGNECLRCHGTRR